MHVTLYIAADGFKTVSATALQLTTDIYLLLLLFCVLSAQIIPSMIIRIRKCVGLTVTCVELSYQNFVCSVIISCVVGTIPCAIILYVLYFSLPLFTEHVLRASLKEIMNVDGVVDTEIVICSDGVSSNTNIYTRISVSVPYVFFFLFLSIGFAVSSCVVPFGKVFWPMAHTAYRN